MDRPLLILDLDETLVHAAEVRLDWDPHFRVSKYFVYRRPHLGEFLDSCFTSFDVAVWTSAGSSYAAEIVDAIMGPRKLRFLWCGERCTRRVDLRTYIHTPSRISEKFGSLASRCIAR